MPKTVITPEVVKYIRKHHTSKTSREIASNLGISRTPVERYRRMNNLGLPPELSRKIAASKIYGRTRVTAEQDEFIKENYLQIPQKRLAIVMGISETAIKGRMHHLRLTIPKEIIQQRKLDSQIKPGDTPANKGKKQHEYMSPEAIKRTEGTRFKKGEVAPNKAHYKDGDITLRHNHQERGEKPHYYIRVKSRIWKELQIYNWEAINGPVPLGYILACQDGDTLNCDPSNWLPITKADNARRNAGHNALPDKYVAGLIARNGRKVDENAREQLMQHPNFLEIKRQQLILQRTIKQHGKSK